MRVLRGFSTQMRIFSTRLVLEEGVAIGEIGRELPDHVGFINL